MKKSILLVSMIAGLMSTSAVAEEALYKRAYSYAKGYAGLSSKDAAKFAEELSKREDGEDVFEVYQDASSYVRGYGGLKELDAHGAALEIAERFRIIAFPSGRQRVHLATNPLPDWPAVRDPG